MSTAYVRRSLCLWMKVVLVGVLWTSCQRALADAPADWTLMAYLSGDGDLEAAAVGYVRMLESVGSSERVNVAVQLDRCEGGDATRPDFADARRMLIDRRRQDSDGIVSTAAEELGEVDMASAATLGAFVRWTRERCPGRRYGLIVMGHGSGLVDLPHPFVRLPSQVCGVCHDETSGTRMSAADLGAALRSFVRDTGEPLIDVLFLDACLTGLLEVVYELRGACRYVTASEYVMLTPGAPWDQILAGLVAWPDMSPREFAANYVWQAAGYWAQVPDVAVTHAAIDVAQATVLARRLGRLSEELTDTIAESAPPVTYARAVSRSFGPNRQYVDLGQFARTLARTHPRKAVRRLAREVAEGVTSAVVTEYHSGPAESRDQEPTGLSVFFPPNLSELPDAYMASASLARETQWGQFLQTYLRHVRRLFDREAA